MIYLDDKINERLEKQIIEDVSLNLSDYIIREFKDRYRGDIMGRHKSLLPGHARLFEPLQFSALFCKKITEGVDITVSFQVHDTRDGIGSRKHKDMFERYMRVDGEEKE